MMTVVLDGREVGESFIYYLRGGGGERESEEISSSFLWLNVNV